MEGPNGWESSRSDRSTGSRALCWNNYDNNVLRLTQNVLTRFRNPAPLGPTADGSPSTEVRLIPPSDMAEPEEITQSVRGDLPLVRIGPSGRAGSNPVRIEFSRPYSLPNSVAASPHQPVKRLALTPGRRCEVALAGELRVAQRRRRSE
jgi:hypothetical protein